MPKPDEQNNVITEDAPEKKKLPPLPENAVEVWKDWRKYTSISGITIRDNAELKCSDSNIPIYVALAQNGSFESEEQKKKAFENLARTMVQLRMNGDTPIDELFPEEKRTPENFKTGMEEIWYVIGQSRLRRDATTDYQPIHFDQNTIYEVKTTLLNDYECLDFDAPEIGENGKKKVPKPKGDTIEKWGKWGFRIKYKTSSGSTVMLYREKRMNSLDDVMNEYRIVNETGDFDSEGSKKRAFNYLAGVMEFFKLNGEIPAEELFPEYMRTPETFKVGVEEVWEMLRVLQHEKVKTLTDENLEAAAQKFLQEYELVGIQSKENRAEKGKSLQDQKIKEMQEKAKKDLEQRIAEGKAKKDTKAQTEQQQAEQQQAKQPKEPEKPKLPKVPAMPDDASKKWVSFKKCLYKDVRIGSDKTLSKFANAISLRKKLAKTGKFSDLDEMDKAFQELAGIMVALELNQGIAEKNIFPDLSKTPEVYMEKADEIYAVVDKVRVRYGIGREGYDVFDTGIGLTKKDFQIGYENLQKEYSIPDSRNTEETKKKAAEIREELQKQKLEKERLKKEEEEKARKKEEEKRRQEEEKKRQEEEKIRQEEAATGKKRLAPLQTGARQKWYNDMRVHMYLQNTRLSEQAKPQYFDYAIGYYRDVIKTGQFESEEQKRRAFKYLTSIMDLLELNGNKSEDELFPEEKRTPENFKAGMEETWYVLDKIGGNASRDMEVHVTPEQLEAARESLFANHIVHVSWDTAPRAENEKPKQEAKQPKAEQPKEPEQQAEQPKAPEQQKEDLKQEEKAPEKPVRNRALEQLRRQHREQRKQLDEEYDREEELKRKREAELEQERREEEAHKKQQEEAAAAKKAKIDKRKAEIADKLKKARTVDDEDRLRRETLPAKLKDYDTPYDAQSWKETREKYMELSNKWMLYDDEYIDVARSLKEIFDNYDKVKKDTKAFKKEMFESLEEVGTLFHVHPRSDNRNHKVFKATVEELHTLLNAYIDIRMDEKSPYNGSWYANFSSGVFDTAYADYKHYLRGNLSYQDETLDEVLALEEEQRERRYAPKKPAPAEDAPIVDVPKQDAPAPAENPQNPIPAPQEQPQQQEQPHPEEQPQQQEVLQKDILDAFESYDVASRQFLWGGSGHRTEFEAIRTAIREFKQEADIGRRSDRAKELYCACRVYLDKHTDNGQRQYDIGGQKQAGGRMRKQAVINIMRILDERSSKATDEHDTYRDIQANYKHYCERTRIPAIEPDYNALEGSLANETCKEVRNSQLPVHEKAYKELQIATEAFRTKRAQQEAQQRPAAGQPQRNLQQPNNNNQNRNQPKQPK